MLSQYRKLRNEHQFSLEQLALCLQTPRNIAISLSLEVSEVLEHFQWGETADRDALAGELADVSLYLLQLAYLCDIDLEQAILDKLAINYRRRWPKGEGE